MSTPHLRLELFVDDVQRSAEFYERVLGFVRQDGAHDDYLPLRLGSVRISLNLMSNLPNDHPVRTAPSERKGGGVEIALDVDDLEGSLARVRASGWPLASDVGVRPWGAKDFRLVDPDGYYLCISCRVRSGATT